LKGPDALLLEVNESAFVVWNRQQTAKEAHKVGKEINIFEYLIAYMSSF